MIDDLHVYIHWPFCRKKCRYCDFISLPERSTHERSRYLEALNRELRYRIGVGMLEQATLQTIYFGGGTPSLMTKDELSLLIEQLESIFPSNNTKEVTLEINPSTISNKTLNEMIECGVNRLSVGIQTFQERYLRFLGRSQTA
ncbi:MAG TPA: radical SAM protein, partial [Atribacteraceae bacterium]|nr:radical SAM protein [Atribacteraceae bacterium]